MRLLLIVFFASLTSFAEAQQITGIWKGRIKSTKVELKLIKYGDSLLGTSYYFTSKNNYRRYSIRGYFDAATNNVVWWDDELLENKSPRKDPDGRLSVANFNCPGEGQMKLDGKTSLRDDKNEDQGPVNLLKANTPDFSDEWDFVIENYTQGANDPYIIDSIAHLNSPSPLVISTQPVERPSVPPDAAETETKKAVLPNPVAAPSGETRVAEIHPPILSVEEKFSTRTKMLQQVIPITGDSIELIFYDNAEIDGDSISLFLNGQKIFEHVMLTDKPHAVKFAVKDLQDDNEAVMVAENLGSIPPNTALMIAMVGDKRYEAHLYSTENSSALIRFVKTAGFK
jgi:hypothetical protein